MAEPMSIEVRNVRFPLGDGVPRYWHGGRRSVTLFFNNLSIFFPAGERFFIASVKRYKDRIKDEPLREEVAAFCAQEGIHGREHIRYNEMIRDQGYPAEELERRVKRILRVVTAVAPKRHQLAATCALEHFTALLAHFLLQDDRLLKGAHPAMAALWRWHAAEENEHKAVAFDVYRLAGGNYLERVVVMVVASLIFWAKIAEQQVRLMKVDGIVWSAREWRSLGRFLFIEPGGMFSLWRAYLEYYRPGFHPWDLDNRDLLERWKAEGGDALAEGYRS